MAERKLPAIHQADLAAVLGEPLPDKWHCALCQRQCEGLPAAFVKHAGELRPICFRCLLEQKNGDADLDGPDRLA